MDVADIAVVGGGASGAILAARLLQLMPSGRLALIEPSGAIGRGIAYGTRDPEHKLNVRAANMSAKPEEPDHFVRWMQSRGDHSPDLASQFVARSRFGDYVEHFLACAEVTSRASLARVADVATSIHRDGQLRLELESGSWSAKHVVLATGNLPPKLPRTLAHLADHPRVIANPWEPGALKDIQVTERVFFVGASLTMVDCVLTLAKRGHQGALITRSRHGLFPQSHKKSSPAPVDIPLGPRLIERIIDAVRDSGSEWRSVVDALRPRTVEMWQSLSWSERARFRNRLQVFWDVHRHRIPEDAADTICRLRADGQLQPGRATILGAKLDGEGISIQLAEPETSEVRVDWIVNCTGPSADLKAAKVPLLESASENGLASYDPLGMGLIVEADGRTNPKGDVWALGPLCRGCRLETTAIPEIRTQAAQLANSIVAELWPKA